MLVKTKPWKHQIDALTASQDHPAFALFMEMRTGKSLVIVETALQYFTVGKIRGVLILAPNGVHDNWADAEQGEVAAHWPPGLDYTALAWQPNHTKAYTAKLEALLNPARQAGKLVWFCMNYEALATDRGFAAALRFLRAYPSLMVADESDLLKNPNSARSKRVHKLGPRAVLRRILTGTPVTQSPLDVWSQFHFLQPGILTTSFPAFRAMHSKIMAKDHPMIRNMMAKNNLRFPPAIPETDDEGKPIYLRLPELEAQIKPHSFRVLRSDCRDMPAKNYVKLPVPLAPEQRALYTQMRTTFTVQLSEGREVSAPLVLTRMLRLQQIVGGFVDDEPIFAPGKNPRINAMLEVIEGISGKVIIWARFKPELLAIHAQLCKEYGARSAALYYGDTSKEDRLEHRRRFLDPDDPLRFMVGQPSSGGVGVPMHSANTVFYYSNEFKLRIRLQSEDRAQHMDKQDPVEYYDLEAPGTIDQRVVEALRNKFDVACAVTGDNWKEWI